MMFERFKTEGLPVAGVAICGVGCMQHWRRADSGDDRTSSGVTADRGGQDGPELYDGQARRLSVAVVECACVGGLTNVIDAAENWKSERMVVV